MISVKFEDNILWSQTYSLYIFTEASFRSSDMNQSSGHICERICFKLIFLNDLFTRAWFRSLRSRICRRPPSFLGTRSGLEERFLWLFFPADSSPLRGGPVHRIKREGARGGVALWKESYPRAQRGETETLAMRATSPAECSISVGFPQAWHTLSVTVISVQGRPACLTMTFATTLCLNLLFCETLLDHCRMAAGDRPDLQADRCKRSNPAAEVFQLRISASVKSQQRRVFIAEEKKCEMRRRSLYSRSPAHFGGLWRAV